MGGRKTSLFFTNVEIFMYIKDAGHLFVFTFMLALIYFPGVLFFTSRLCKNNVQYVYMEIFIAIYFLEFLIKRKLQKPSAQEK